MRSAAPSRCLAMARYSHGMATTSRQRSGSRRVRRSRVGSCAPRLTAAHSAAHTCVCVRRVAGLQKQWPSEAPATIPVFCQPQPAPKATPAAAPTPASLADSCSSLTVAGQASTATSKASQAPRCGWPCVLCHDARVHSVCSASDATQIAAIRTAAHLVRRSSWQAGVQRSPGPRTAQHHATSAVFAAPWRAAAPGAPSHVIPTFFNRRLCAPAA
jgi:hypothetical protein